MENIATVEDRINELAENSEFTAYVKGGIKKFTNMLRSQGWEIEEINHQQNYMGWGVAVTQYSGYTPEGEAFEAQVNWG